MQTYQTDWEKDFDQRFEGYWRGNAVPDEIKFFIRSLLQAREEWLYSEVKKIMNDYEEPDFSHETADAIQKHAVKTFNRILSLLTPKN